MINTISAILAQQTRQIGIMKTFGADTPLIMGLYFRVVFIFCLFALIMAVPLGGLGALGLTRFVAWQINFDVNQFY